MGLLKQKTAVQDFLTYKMSKEKTDRGFTRDEEENIIIDKYLD